MTDYFMVIIKKSFMNTLGPFFTIFFGQTDRINTLKKKLIVNVSEMNIFYDNLK